MASKTNQNHFTVALAAVAAASIGAVAGQSDALTIAELFSTKLFNAAGPLSLFLGFIYFLKGTKFDVLEEVFERKNVAVAVFLYAIAEIFVKAFSRG